MDTAKERGNNIGLEIRRWKGLTAEMTSKIVSFLIKPEGFYHSLMVKNINMKVITVRDLGL